MDKSDIDAHQAEARDVLNGFKTVKTSTAVRLNKVCDEMRRVMSVNERLSRQVVQLKEKNEKLEKTVSTYDELLKKEPKSGDGEIPDFLRDLFR